MKLLLVLLLAPVLHAATYLVPGDAELIQGADDIVFATGGTSWSERDVRGGIVTRCTLRVEETLKGDALPGAYLVLTELGGAIGNRSRIVPGAPRYEPGVRYLVFTSTNRDLGPSTSGMSLGQFHLQDGLALRHGIHGWNQNLAAHVEPVRDAHLFARYIRDVVAQRFSPANYFVAPAAVTMTETMTETLTETMTETMTPSGVLVYSRYSYLLEEGAIGYRWKNPVVDWVRNGTQPGADGAAAVLKELAAWSATDSTIDYRDAGVDPAATTGLNPDDGRNAILFNDPNDEIADNSGVLGIGGASGGDPYVLDEEQFFEILEGDVVLANRPFSQTCLDTLVAHELGHTLGIRHSGEPPTGTECGSTAQCTSEAIMNSSIHCAYAGVLKGWDENAAATVYGDGVDCDAPAIFTQPASRSVHKRASFKIDVEATGTEPLTFAWFEGERGVTTRPVGTGAQQLIIASGRSASTKFWVRVTNDCGSADSEVAVVTIPVKRRAVRP